MICYDSSPQSSSRRTPTPTSSVGLIRIPANMRHKRHKAFGQIIKLLFILCYVDDVELQQVSEKQLNKIELANRFTRAVAVGDSREFTQTKKESQAERKSNCKFCPLALCGRNSNRSIMFIDNAPDNRQPLSAAFTNRFCREKWIKYFADVGLGNPNTCICKM
jgi:hypothetical protein